jgi:hypothetical protein
MDRDIDNSGIAAGHAALAICESLLLALVEQKIISRRDTLGVLDDAAAIHREANTSMPQEMENRRQASQLIDRIISDLGPLFRS